MKYHGCSEINHSGSLRGSHGGDSTTRARAHFPDLASTGSVARITEPTAASASPHTQIWEMLVNSSRRALVHRVSKELSTRRPGALGWVLRVRGPGPQDSSSTPETGGHTRFKGCHKNVPKEHRIPCGESGVSVGSRLRFSRHRPDRDFRK